MNELDISEPDSVVVLSDAGGVMVTGTELGVGHLVRSLIAQGGVAHPIEGAVADAAFVGASVATGIATTSQYVRFSPRAMSLLADHGAIPTPDGFFRSFVRSDSAFTGNLDWTPVSFGPEQALALQQMAATWALRSAIK